MKLMYYHSSDHRVFMEDPANAGVGEVEKLLELVEQVGANVEIVDTAELEDEERLDIYARHAVGPAVRNRYPIRQIFGTRRRGGFVFFGRQVPALVVLKDGDRVPADVYPHGEGGRIITIREFLTAFLGDPGRHMKEDSAGAGAISLARIEQLVRLRGQIFGDRLLSGDSAEIIRQARETR